MDIEKLNNFFKLLNFKNVIIYFNKLILSLKN